MTQCPLKPALALTPRPWPNLNHPPWPPDCALSTCPQRLLGAPFVVSLPAPCTLPLSYPASSTSQVLCFSRTWAAGRPFPLLSWFNDTTAVAASANPRLAAHCPFSSYILSCSVLYSPHQDSRPVGAGNDLCPPNARPPPSPFFVLPQPAAARDLLQSAPVMSSADDGERGGTAPATRSRTSSAVHSPVDFSQHPAASAHQLSSTGLDDTSPSLWSGSLDSTAATTANTTSNEQSPANLPSTAALHPSAKPSHLSHSQHPDFRSNLDLSASDALARNESLLQDAVFPEWKDDASPSDAESPGKMQEKDPLGTQIWKLYSRTKSRLPNQERMENLTWRMMAMNLRRREQQQAAYAVLLSSSWLFGRNLDTDCGFREKQARLQRLPSAPSGIAQQLRKSVDNSAEKPVDIEPSADPMNLDDFIVPSSVASPAGIITPAPSEPAATPVAKSVMPAAIAITSRSKPHVQIPKNLPPSSMPQTSVPIHRNTEFDYVRKRVRKTSIDERRAPVCP
jgi:hypothetical protein